MKKRILRIMFVLFCVLLTYPGLSEGEAEGTVCWFVENGKIGLRDKDGTVLHAPEFDYVTWFDENGLAFVEQGKQQGMAEKGDVKKGAMNQRGEMVIPLDAYDYVDYGTYGGFPRNKINCAVDEKHNYIYSLEGRLIYPEPVEYAYPFIDGKAFIKQNGKYNQINEQGELLLETWLDSLFKTPAGTEAYVRKEQEENKFTFYRNDVPFAKYEKNAEGEYVLKAAWRSNEEEMDIHNWEDIRVIHNEIYAVKVNGQWGLVGTEGNTVLAPRFANIHYAVEFEGPAQPAQEDIICISTDESGRKGWAKTDGTIVVPAEWNWITQVARGLWCMERIEEGEGGETKYVCRFADKEGTTLWEMPEGLGVQSFDGEYIVYCTYPKDRDAGLEGSEWGIMNLKGEILSSYPGNWYPNTASDPEFFVSEDGVIFVIENRLTAQERQTIRDVYGNILIEAKDGESLNNSHLGYIHVTTKMGKEGFMDLSGNYVIPPIYERVWDFEMVGNTLLAEVRFYGYSRGFIDKNGNRVAGDVEFLSNKR